MEYVIRYVTIMGFLLGVVACAPAQKVMNIASKPEEVSILVDGEPIGTTPTKYAFSFPAEGKKRHSITGKKKGYYDRTHIVTEEDLKVSDYIEIVLESHTKTAFITSNPNTALVKINGENVGQTPAGYSFDFSEKHRRYGITVSKSGFFDSTVVVDANSPAIRSGTINVVLEENPSWNVTSESEATNRWLRIAVDPSISYDNAWQKIIDSVTMRYDSLEQLDQASGYLRSSSKIREFPKGPDGPFLVRMQFLGSVSSKEPLTYKIKLLATTRRKDKQSSWQKFDRVFAEDAELVEELQNRLGLK